MRTAAKTTVLFMHSNTKTGATGPKPVYVSSTGRRSLRLAPVPGLLIALFTLFGMFFVGESLLTAMLYALGFGGMMVVATLLAVRIAVMPRAHLVVMERMYEARTNERRQGMHIVSVDVRGKYLLITTESDGIVTLLSHEPEKAKDALLELRKRARES